MEESNDTEDNFDIEKIVIALENIERDNLKDNVEIVEWINKMIDPDFKFVDSLVDLIVNDLNNHKLIQTVLKIFLKFLYYQKETMLNQLQDNPDLLKTLIKYVSENDIKSLSGEPFVMIVEICNKGEYKSLNTKLIVTTLLNSISYIEDDGTLRSIIKILTSINYNIEEFEENFFLKVFVTHENSRFFIESLLRVLNYEEDKPTLYRLLQCCIDITNYTQSSYFYSTDMESFINIAVKKLESTFTDKLRYFILSLLERVTFFDDYYKDKYKIDIIFELMEDYATNDEVDEFNQKISSKIIENLKRNLNKK